MLWCVLKPMEQGNAEFFEDIRDGRDGLRLPHTDMRTLHPADIKRDTLVTVGVIVTRWSPLKDVDRYLEWRVQYRLDWVALLDNVTSPPDYLVPQEPPEMHASL